MNIKEINIKNFRGIKDLTLNLNNFTILIGKNGVGKSSILHALNFFKDPKFNLSKDDYYNKNLSERIEISITFVDLTSQEKDEFQYYIQNEELKVIKIGISDKENDLPNISQKYHGLKKSHKEFNLIRNAPNKTEQKRLYNNLRNEVKYSTLTPIGTRSADLIEGFLKQWEDDNPDELELMMDSGQFFGWTGVGIGKLGKYMEFFFIPAVHEYSIEEKAEGSTYLNELLDLTIRKTSEESADLIKFKEEVAEKYKDIIDIETESKIETLSKDLSERLNKFAPGCDVFLNYIPGDVQFRPTRYGTELKEYGFKGPISFLGHGVQRSFFFTLLQYLGEQRTLSKSHNIENEDENNVENLVMNDKYLILLVIEEPELYQHPNRIKLIKRLFKNLTLSENNSKFKIQIICSSHSSYLIDIQDVENIRILRKVKEDTSYKVSVKKVELKKIAQELKALWGFPDDYKFDEDTLLSRLISIMKLEISEGFFAEKVVLVEGLEDLSVLLALDYQVNSKTIDDKGISIIPVLGKRNLDRLALIFKELNIPTYVIFDTDSNKIGSDLELHKQLNIILRKIMGDFNIENPFEQRIEKEWASLDPKMTSIIKTAVGEEFYNDQLIDLKNFYGFQKTRDVKKNYIVMAEFIRRCYAHEKKIPILEEILQKIHLS